MFETLANMTYHIVQTETHIALVLESNGRLHVISCWPQPVTKTRLTRK